MTDADTTEPRTWDETPGWASITYTGVTELRGPLMTVSGAAGVGWDEFADIRVVPQDGDGEEERRHGLVLDTSADRVLVQVLEGTGGMRPGGTRITFSGTPMRIPVGPQWLGRACDGLGRPLDGGSPVFGTTTAPVAGLPLNPVHREPPAEAVLTGISVIDALTTLARGQKLPVFSTAGLPHLELAAQIAAQASAGGEPFCVVFAAMGLTHADAAAVRRTLEDRSAAGDLVLLLNLADAPVIERLMTPRIALTVAEHLAFDLGRHVLVVMGDMTAYCEALREVSAARGEIPARRAYPGYLYSDLASLYERCGRVRGRTGSVTLLPVLTMPGGDITHPVPDLTAYITEGQIVLSPDLHARGVYPPVDALGSLSRLMRKAAGPGRTRPDHLDVAAQILAALAQARRVRELGELVGTAALSDTDRRYLDFERRYESTLVGRRALLLATPSEHADVTIDNAVTMGVRHPARATCTVPQERSRAPDGLAFASARRACQDALQAACAHAATTAALAALDREITATRQRLRAIERRWLPHLRTALAQIEFVLEEQEREDRARLRRGTARESA